MRVGDVTNLRGITGPFDLALDIGCFHGVDDKSAYLDELDRLLAPGGHWLLYGFFKPTSGQTGTGFTEDDLDQIQTRGFSLLSRTDGFDRKERPSAWLLFEKRDIGSPAFHASSLPLPGWGWTGRGRPRHQSTVRARMPNLRALLGGHSLTASAAPFEGERATLLALDATLGVEGLPQSATGQAVLLTGINIPKEIGYHYGPKPNPEVATYLKNGNTFFSWLRASGKSAGIAQCLSPTLLPWHRFRSKAVLLHSAGTDQRGIPPLHQG